jgi:UDP-2-acetamido-3-amino-2,3-dideoxy-glucuronate N-acetyltransferase
MSKTYALVGVGRWGKNLARNLHRLNVLHTICDTREDLLDAFQQNYPDVNFSSNYQSVLKNPEISQIVIAAPALLHYKLAKEALLAKKDVYVEKPLCVDSAEGEELIELAKKGGQILMVGHLLQYHPCVQKLQEMVGKGDLGKLQYIVSNRLNLGSIRTEENALWNFAPHDVSVILSLCGHKLPEQVRCTGACCVTTGIADATLTTLKFDNDLKAHIFVSWLHPFKEQKLTVVGTHGMAVFDDTKPWKEKLVFYPSYIKWEEGRIPQIDQKGAVFVEVLEKEPLFEECSHFIKCCRERVAPRTDGEEGLRVLKVLQAAQSSLNVEGEAKDPSKEHQLAKLKGPNYFSHPTACIDPGAEIGEGSKIWHFCHVMNQAKVGKECNIGQNVVISPNVVLGNRCKVQNNVSLYTGVILEEDVFLGPSMVFTNIKNPRAHVVRRDLYTNTLVKKGATIGANATIVTGIEIGEYAFIGAGAVVTKNVKPYALVVGNPGKQIGWMSKNGQRLDLPVATENGMVKEAHCPVTQELYQLTGDVLTCVVCVGV